jgi:hypothetical protein
MAKFTVSATEVVYYMFDVEANSIDEAREMLADGNFETGEPCDGDDFQVLDVYQSDFDTP